MLGSEATGQSLCGCAYIENREEVMSTCQIHKYGSCCCNCKFHLADHSHPGTDGGRVINQRGWICSPPESEMAFSGWTDHGMCEMHIEAKKTVENA